MVSLIKVINLDKRPERLNTFNANIQNSILKTIPVERFSAINGIDLINDIKTKQLNDDPIFEALNKLNIIVPKGELGCLLSHYFVLKEVIQNDKLSDNDYVLIFEDDVFFTDYDQTKYFEHIDEFIKSNQVDFVFVSGRWQPHFIAKSMNFFERKSKHFFQRKAGKGYDWDRCAPAYICTKEGARKMYMRVLSQFADKKQWMAIDNIYSMSTSNVVTYDFFPHIYYCKPDYQTDIQGHHLSDKIQTHDIIFSL
jgi:GR25 family glycosyltransferase involved in LPS biosynthesis